MIRVGEAQKNGCVNANQRLLYPFRSSKVKPFSGQYQVVDILKLKIQFGTLRCLIFLKLSMIVITSDNLTNSIFVMLMLLVSPFLMNRVYSPTFARFSNIDV